MNTLFLISAVSAIHLSSVSGQSVWNVNVGSGAAGSGGAFEITTSDNYLGAASENTANSTWNAVTSTDVATLTDSTGSSAAGVTFTISPLETSSMNFGAQNITGDEIFDTWIKDNGNNDPFTVTFGNLPVLGAGGSYSLIIYSDWWWKNGGGGQSISQTAGTGLADPFVLNRYIGGNPTTPADVPFGTVTALAEDTDPANVNGQTNFARFDGLSPDGSNELSFSMGDLNGPINGFQLIQIEGDSFSLVDFTYDPVSGDSQVSILGSPSTVYLLVESDDLDFANPDQSPLPLTGATVGTLDGNLVTTDSNGAATVQFNLGTAKPATFIRAEVAPPPPPLIVEDFEGGVIPAGWAVTDNGNGTAWTVGTPNGATTEPDSAIGGTFCAGTNMNGDYANSAGCNLISPSFAVPAGGATLMLSYYIDTEDVTGGQDFGTIRLLNAIDDTPLVGGDVQTSLEGVSETWLVDQVIALPAAANGLSVKLEFAFESDADDSNFSGFYIDEVNVSAN